MVTTIDLQACCRNYFNIFGKLMQNCNLIYAKIRIFADFYRLYQDIFVVTKVVRNWTKNPNSLNKIKLAWPMIVYVVKQCWDITKPNWDRIWTEWWRLRISKYFKKLTWKVKIWLFIGGVNWYWIKPLEIMLQALPQGGWPTISDHRGRIDNAIHENFVASGHS